MHSYIKYNYVHLLSANCSGSPLPEDIVIINSTSSQLTYNCDCSTSMMKTARLPQVSCGGYDCTVGTDSEGTYVATHVSNYILCQIN